MADIEEFLRLEVRAGTVVSAEPLRGARKPSVALEVDFGASGVRNAVAEIRDHYDPEKLVGLQVVAVVNLPPEEIAGFTAEARVLVVDDGRGQNVLVIPERPVPDGSRAS